MRQTVRGKFGSGRKHRLTQQLRKRAIPMTDMVAYDLETTPIKAGTPEPLYITAYADHHDYVLSTEITSVKHLAEVIEEQFLQPRFNQTKFVAWNGNGYDVYFVAMALMSLPQYILRPYLTKSKALRGVRVIHRDDIHLKPKSQRSWEFADGIAMLGLQGKTLKEFLKTFAPEYTKHERESFDKRGFDPKDAQDIAYAFRDSEGLYWGMQKAQEIVYERFGLPLQTTMGNLGIKIFQTRIPEETTITEPSLAVLKILREYVCRGGYCHLMKKYKGKVWKYDLNQAYAAAMREADMPAGDCRHLKGESRYSKCYIARISATNPTNIIPFYCRGELSGKLRSQFATTTIEHSWVTSSEVAQLRAEGWKLTVHESYVWYDEFRMKDYVDALETLRANAPGGPSGGTGTMVKQIGNNSYGKTLEQLEPLELVLSAECPPGFSEYWGTENPEVVPYVWCRFIETPSKKYHQPQIGAFITAHVRMVIRRAALLAPEQFLYADTDCVIFSKDVTKQLDIDPRRYGAFKLEESGAEYLLIAKKVYASSDFKTKHSKGLAVRQLSFLDFTEWYEGRVPVQQQAQRQNFVKFLNGDDMFVNRKRKGTAVK